MASVIPEDEFLQAEQIDKIKGNRSLSKEVKRSLITEVKKSFTGHKNSSMRTIFSVANTMVGSAIVVFGIQFQKSGIFSSLITMVLMCLITLKTCSLEIRHFRLDESDFPDILNRILGKKWNTIFALSSFVLLFLVGAIYFTLAMNMLYPSIKFIVESSSDTILPALGDQKFDQFSYQYTGMIGSVIFFFLYNLKELRIMLKFSVLGIMAVSIFVIYSVVKAFQNISNISNLHLFDADPKNYIVLLGIYSLSFMIHNVIVPIMKNNKEYKNNNRDLAIGYGLTAGTYGLVGTFGAIAIAGLSDGSQNTFFDVFVPSWITCTIRLFLFVQLSTVLPIIWFVARSQLFSVLYPETIAPAYVYQGMNLLFLGFSLIMQMFNVNPSIMISITGAVGGFMLMYIIPIKLHMDCIARAVNVGSGKENLLDNNTNGSNNILISDMIDEEEEQEKAEMQKCTSNHEVVAKRTPLATRKIVYGLIILLALIIMIFQFYELIVKLAS